IKLDVVEYRQGANQRFGFIHPAVSIVQLLKHQMVAIKRIGGYSDDVFAFAHFEILRGFDRSENVAHSRNAEQLRHRFDRISRNAETLFENLHSDFVADQLQSFFTLHIVDAHNRVHCMHVVDPSYMLIADALNIVASVAVVEKSRTLNRLKSYSL